MDYLTLESLKGDKRFLVIAGRDPKMRSRGTTLRLFPR